MKSCIFLALLLLIQFSKAQSYVADFSVANESVLRSIPQEYINKARKEFKIAYQHSTQGSHISYGMFGLPDYKDGDKELFAISRNRSMHNQLSFYDYAMEIYSEDGVDASDLSSNATGFIQTTRNFLDNPKNKDVNVVMWSWGNINGHQVAVTYLSGMKKLIAEYGVGGSKIGKGSGQRIKPVHFIFMTGGANANDNIGYGKAKNQAKIIVDFCKKNKYYCLDNYSIDSHCVDGNHYSDSNDDGDSFNYGGNFLKEYQNTVQLGENYYENKTIPGGHVSYGGNNTQHISGNRKAYAMWWILARLAGWANSSTHVQKVLDKSMISYDSANKRILFSGHANGNNSICRIYSITGSLVFEQGINAGSLSVRNLRNGMYIISLATSYGSVTKKIVVQQ